ncbi:glycosyltransferase [Streptomyces sp. NBC_00094]|uniref:glycosyltransferase n=1 Tax=Streptomyces sp. NBC_00094 TaxID=2903620 RepID=UPI00224DF317|nr:glycosyltransferase [Streptomyces sp. NBC_00094]MCX5388964.1 glycosyltransferase [Streptomyces sp. NBC_00094]
MSDVTAEPLHIIETYFECCGFDHTFLQGGTSVYLWNLSRAFARRGHRVSIVTPAHGRLDDLRSRHDVEDLDYDDRYTLPLVLDPEVWKGFPAEVPVELRTTAHRIRREDVDLYFLSNAYLDRLPDTFYPPYGAKGNDLTFFKPLVFQVDSVRFLRSRFADERAVVHAHEPYYHYLLPPALSGDPLKSVVTTVQSNMPITKKVYGPEVRRLLAELGAPPLPHEAPALPAGEREAQRQYQERTHLHYEYRSDHLTVYDLVADHSDRIDFLSPGQRDFYSGFRDTPFQDLFAALPVAGTVRRNAHKQFVGGCAISDSWLAGDPDAVDRAEVLTGLGLDPERPTFFHNARYAVHHKGQVELLRAIDRVLSEGLDANFVLRCISPTGIDDPYVHDVAKRHHGRVHLEWERVDESRVFAYASSADFCVFPSKFEMDTFLIAQGEAMACGAVPVATAQWGMAHFLHDAPKETGTGFSVNRSFAEDDALLVAALADRFREAVALFRDRPEEYRALSAHAREVARSFTWERCADLHLEVFSALWRGEPAVLGADDALRQGWFDLLPSPVWSERPEDVRAAAVAAGDLAAVERLGPVTAEIGRRLFDAAWERADFAVCEEVVRRLPGLPAELTAPLRDRCVPGADGLVYRLPHAERVELVVPSPRAPEGRASAEVTAWTRTGPGEFTGAAPPAGSAARLLLTLSNGRVAWDEVHGG